MSKKKATMTLKDFHGGSIPSDLHLPSAPGVTVKPIDRSSFDRPMSWGNSAGRSEHRLRPSSAGSTRNIDEKSPFLSHSSHIGRNFDEDERKPLDRVSGPRRTVADEKFHAQLSRNTEHKTDNTTYGARVGTSPSIHASQLLTGSTGSSYSGRVELHNSKFNNQALSGSRNYGSSYPVVSGSAGQAVTGSHPNAWGVRKEPPSVKEPASAAWSAPDAETKLAHASALEKVSSGRWNSKQQINSRKDPAVSGCPETDGKFEYSSSNAYSKKTYNWLHMAIDADSQENGLVMHGERGITVGDGIHGGGKEVPPTYERARSTVRVESYERNSAVTASGMQSIHSSAKPAGTESHPTLSSESSERPKLKLLPRSKPLENIESPIDYKQRYEQTSDHLYEEENHEAKIPVADRAPERPKLYLKPRSKPIEQVEGNSEVKRGTVFGEARPREMVLKARGIEDDVNSCDGQPPLRVEEVSQKADAFIHSSSAQCSEKSEGIPSDQRMVKNPNRRDTQVDERGDSQRRNKQSEIWKNNRDAEKHRNQQQKQVQDRPPSPETWRKPIDNANPASTDIPLRYCKAASAVELAQAFSKSVSDPTAGRLPGSGGNSGRNQLPFSRLTGPSTRPQINGY